MKTLKHVIAQKIKSFWHGFWVNDVMCSRQPWHHQGEFTFGSKARSIRVTSKKWGILEEHICLKSHTITHVPNIKLSSGFIRSWNIQHPILQVQSWSSNSQLKCSYRGNSKVACLPKKTCSKLSKVGIFRYLNSFLKITPLKPSVFCCLFFCKMPPCHSIPRSCKAFSFSITAISHCLPWKAVSLASKNPGFGTSGAWDVISTPHPPPKEHTAPVDMVNIPSFTGFHTCQVVDWDFWTINSIKHVYVSFTAYLDPKSLKL